MVGADCISKIFHKTMKKVLAVIPARYESSRFPGKPLALIKGKEMILRVAERAAKCKKVDEFIVATDDERIRAVVEKSGFKAVITAKTHASGTDRIAEAAKGSNAEIIVNIQGDEPMMDTPSIDRAIDALLVDDSLNVATLAVPLKNMATFGDPNVVKVVFDYFGNAMYFSRAPIPHNRDGGSQHEIYKHLGLYVYRKNFLIKFSLMEQSSLEKTELLEQLRILQNGVKIRVVISEKDSMGVDTPEDLKKVEALIDG
jgi:3-deoxy-manno-octulosonate cytidylyltransferase (CMP-KDO synthetase)